MPFAYSETPDHVRATLGALLKAHRESSRLSLADVAGEAGISAGFLSEVERGRKDISTERLIGLARALGVPVAELYHQLGTELGGGEPLNAVAFEADPRVQLRRMSETLNHDALRTVARFSAFLATTEGDARKRPIGFLR